MTLQWLSWILNGAVLVLSASVLALPNLSALQHGWLANVLFVACLVTLLRVRRDSGLRLKSTTREIHETARRKQLMTPLEHAAFLVGLGTIIYAAVAG
jgi:hypothetical protein